MKPTVPHVLPDNHNVCEIEDALDRWIMQQVRGEAVTTLRFPPLMSIDVLKRNNYFVGFPHLAGCIHSFTGSSEEHKALLFNLLCDDPIDEFLSSTGLVLTPAACYPVYPAVAQDGPLPAGGMVVSVHSWCFRHEPSADPARKRAFRMREFICFGSDSQTLAFRDAWMKRALGLVGDLGLHGNLDAANDPFFGTEGETLGEEQRARSLKFEMLLPIHADRPRTACMSFNYHETHFGGIWDIQQHDETVAHTACVGFGIERLVLALRAAHGMNREDWPTRVKEQLWPNS